eukprot:TRINITY_DN54477_c0_g1_i1.p1 TRINITY_DN54477_c0_g1~~TRINITY_DN54477_c0_g1_i1.p1  ORF type:complete len:903 (+),score=138.75 TRINITY_DN54477_c0_g1_i1:141-2849(+)
MALSAEAVVDEDWCLDEAANVESDPYLLAVSDPYAEPILETDVTTDPCIVGDGTRQEDAVVDDSDGNAEQQDQLLPTAVGDSHPQQLVYDVDADHSEAEVYASEVAENESQIQRLLAEAEADVIAAVEGSQVDRESGHESDVVEVVELPADEQNVSHTVFECKDSENEIGAHQRVEPYDTTFGAADSPHQESDACEAMEVGSTSPCTPPRDLTVEGDANQRSVPHGDMIEQSTSADDLPSSVLGFSPSPQVLNGPHDLGAPPATSGRKPVVVVPKSKSVIAKHLPPRRQVMAVTPPPALPIQVPIAEEESVAMSFKHAGAISADDTPELASVVDEGGHCCDDEIAIVSVDIAQTHTLLDPATDSESESGDRTPRWLQVEPDPEDIVIANDAEMCTAFLDGLPEDAEEEYMGLDQVCPRLQQYLIGHPKALVTKKRKVKGGGKRYFGGDGRSEDVMSDKVVTGCWACGKLDHDSNQCAFKRCFVCSGQGHEQHACPHKKEWCKMCKVSGHEEGLSCPGGQYAEGLAQEADGNSCRCIKCRSEGHVNCGSIPFAKSPGWQAFGCRGSHGTQQSSIGTGGWVPKHPGGLILPTPKQSQKAGWGLRPPLVLPGGCKGSPKPQVFQSWRGSAGKDGWKPKQPLEPPPKYMRGNSGARWLPRGIASPQLNENDASDGEQDGVGFEQLGRGPFGCQSALSPRPSCRPSIGKAGAGPDWRGTGCWGKGKPQQHSRLALSRMTTSDFRAARDVARSVESVLGGTEENAFDGEAAQDGDEADHGDLCMSADESQDPGDDFVESENGEEVEAGGADGRHAGVGRPWNRGAKGGKCNWSGGGPGNGVWARDDGGCKNGWGGRGGWKRSGGSGSSAGCSQAGQGKGGSWRGHSGPRGNNDWNNQSQRNGRWQQNF